MSENIPSMVDWYYWMPYTKLAGAKGVKMTYSGNPAATYG